MAFKLSSAFLVLMGMALILPSYAQENLNDYLKPQNEARTEHSIQPQLAWDAKLAAAAQAGVNQHTSACKVEQSGGPKNLFKAIADQTAAYVNAQWIGEKYFYDVKTGSCFAPNKYCGNFANIINPKFSNVGCAKAKCNDGSGVIFECDFQ